MPEPAAATEPGRHLPRLPEPADCQRGAGAVAQLPALLLPGQNHSRDWVGVSRFAVTCVCVPQSCWQEYLTARIEQNLVMNCNCPITDCQAQPTSHFFLSILTDKDTVAKVTQASQPRWDRSRAGADPAAPPSPSVRERPAARLRGVLLQPDVVHQPPGLRPDPLQGEHGQHRNLLQVLLVLLLQLQLP